MTSTNLEFPEKIRNCFYIYEFPSLRHGGMDETVESDKFHPIFCFDESFANRDPLTLQV